jgi:hypothetical protein
VRDRKAARWSGRDIPQRVPVAGDRSQMRTASSRVLIPPPPLPMLFVLWSSQEPQVRYAMDVIFETKERVRIAPKARGRAITPFTTTWVCVERSIIHAHVRAYNSANRSGIAD